MLVTFRSEQQRAVIPTRHYPQSYHDLLFVRWQGGGMSVEEESPQMRVRGCTTTLTNGVRCLRNQQWAPR